MILERSGPQAAQQVPGAPFPLYAYGFWCADFRALGVSPAEITMVGLIVKNHYGVKRTSFSPFFVPEEFLFFQSLLDMFSIDAFHVFTLKAKGRCVKAGAQIILPNTNGRFLYIDCAYMRERADHLTQMTAATFFLIHLYLHISMSNLCRVRFFGTKFLYQP